MVLLGHNGAGKTTLLNYITGLYGACGQHPFLPALKPFAERLREGLGHYAYSPESAYLDYESSATDYFRLMASVHGCGEYDQPGLLQRVGLEVEPDKPIKHYSKGMKQRLMLALALLPDPDTLILDEPTSGLDPYGRAAVEALLLELARSHRLILSTHSLDLAAQLGDEVCILRHGEVVFEGRVDERFVLESLMHRYRPEVHYG